MLQSERYDRIIELLSARSPVSISDLENALCVSRATIYRDIKAMQHEGKILIVRGGVSMPPDARPIRQEAPYDDKMQANIEEKVRIAAYAAASIEPGSTIFMDSSTTVLQMCPYIRKLDNVFVITNDLRIASELNTSGLSVYVTGGHLRPNFYTLTDWALETRLQEVSIDVAFLSCDAITLHRGCMITNDDEVPLKKLVITKLAQKSVMLCDHSKFNHTAFMSFAGVGDFSQIITGRELDDGLHAAFVNAYPGIARV